MRYRCQAFMMHGCQKNIEKGRPLICCQSCSQKAECYFACMNNPRKCGMSKSCPEVEEPMKKKAKKTKPICKLDADTGEVLAVYESVESAAHENMISPSTLYSAVRLGQIRRGCKWRYKEE